MGGIRIRLLAVSGAACAALALAASASADSTARPRKGNFASTCSGSGTCLTFSGQLTHLGSFTGQITSVTNPGQPGCSEAGAVGCTTATWTAANGDSVNVSTVFYITGLDSSTGLYEFSQAITINGGSVSLTRPVQPRPPGRHPRPSLPITATSAELSGIRLRCPRPPAPPELGCGLIHPFPASGGGSEASPFSPRTALSHQPRLR